MPQNARQILATLKECGADPISLAIAAADLVQRCKDGIPFQTVSPKGHMVEGTNPDPKTELATYKLLDGLYSRYESKVDSEGSAIEPVTIRIQQLEVLPGEATVTD